MLIVVLVVGAGGRRRQTTQPTCPPRSRASSATLPSRARGSARWPRYALRRVQFLPQLLHQLQLRLEVVDVFFLVGNDLLQQDGAGAVLLFAAHDDSRLE